REINDSPAWERNRLIPQVQAVLLSLLLVGCSAAAPAVPATAGPTVAPALSQSETESTESTPTAMPQNASTMSVEATARKLLGDMTLEQRVGQVFMLGFEGTTLNNSNRALIRDLHLGGVTLFARNIQNATQLAKLDADVQSIADPVPLFVSVDQEGGLVVRVTEGATIFPGNMAVGATRDSVLARQVAEASADELLAMGVNMSLAPVVDVNTNPLNPVIGVRSFGSDASAVAQMSQETVRGLQGNGVSAVAKHFPGHGDTAVDSHLDLPVVTHSLERLQSTEFMPFQAAMQAGVDGIMTAHLYLPSIEPQANRPATLSRLVLTGLLREALDYQGLILTDALDMEAIKRDRGAAEAAVEAFEAGADMLLVAGITAADRARLGEGPPALLAAVRSGRVSEQRLNASVLRVLEAKLRRGIVPGVTPLAVSPPIGVLNSPEHRALALDTARRAVTLQRDEEHLLPLRADQRVLVVVPDAPTRSLAQDDELASSLLEAVRQFTPGAVGTSTVSAIEAAQTADVVVLGTFDLAQSVAQQTLAKAITALGKPVVAVALRGPYDADATTEIGTFITVYGDRPVHLQAAAEALFGALTPSGRVP
ncbi:MAG TPA: beta-N-acetylhexosaminidase, partial [Chloroflexota bacterium]|nr:beta-N-acetylhexosaminidase [Chloroflexota bacterium]